eukprot:15463486-Alexandrium_andersonii.AAC.1
MASSSARSARADQSTHHACRNFMPASVRSVAKPSAAQRENLAGRGIQNPATASDQAACSMPGSVEEATTGGM